MKILIWLVSIAAIGLGAAIAVSGPGSQMGLWGFSDGLSLIRTLAFPVMIATGVAAIAFVVSLFVARGAAPLALIAVIAGGTASMVPVKLNEAFQSNPPIHDITTDFENPPMIVAGANAERRNPPEYLGDASVMNSDLTVTEAQQQAFPDIAPHLYGESVESVAETVRGILGDMGMEIIGEQQIENGLLIEATYTSFWYGFVDDFVVRISADNAMTRVDVRSKSRIGTSDLGANAARIRAFLERLDKAVD
ncbi:MAG: DUF1499 domain-containing protein [Pseudomonadota bacterium]